MFAGKSNAWLTTASAVFVVRLKWIGNVGATAFGIVTGLTQKIRAGTRSLPSPKPAKSDPID
jgi:hypothetical protein